MTQAKTNAPCSEKTFNKLFCDKITPMWSFKFSFCLIFGVSKALSESTNCTANCLTMRRDWPHFDFEFYYDQSGTRQTVEPSQISYIVQLESRQLFSSNSIHQSMSTPHLASAKFLRNNTISSSSISSIAFDKSLNSIQPTKHLSSVRITENCTEGHQYPNRMEQHMGNVNQSIIHLQNYLLRSAFRNVENSSLLDQNQNLSSYFHDKLSEIYRFALERQREHQLLQAAAQRKLLSYQPTINLVVWDLQVDNSSKRIDVIYYLYKEGVLVPYEDATKIMSFVSTEYIQNQTGYGVVHKVSRYNPEWKEAAVSTAWLHWIWLTIIFLLLACSIVSVLLLYLKYRNERRRWLDTINRELNRVMPTNLPPAQDESHSQWNRIRDNDNVDEGESTSVKVAKIDQSSQYEYTAPWAHSVRTDSPSSNTNEYEPMKQNRERLIPVSGIPYQNKDYDRISYVRTQETIQETKKYPNILEIQLSKETQSIVQDIRKELNRYNFKKIIDYDISNATSEA